MAQNTVAQNEGPESSAAKRIRDYADSMVMEDQHRREAWEEERWGALACAFTCGTYDSRCEGISPLRYGIEATSRDQSERR